MTIAADHARRWADWRATAAAQASASLDAVQDAVADDLRAELEAGATVARSTDAGGRPIVAVTAAAVVSREYGSRTTPARPALRAVTEAAQRRTLRELAATVRHAFAARRGR